MKVPFWKPSRDYERQKEEILGAIDRILSNGELVLGFGKDIEELEKKFAEYVGTKHAIMCGGGTHALYLVYRALGFIGKDEIIVPSHTFAATFDQIVALGATPVFIDINEYGVMDTDLIKSCITPLTKAIVPVHLEGKMVDMDALMRVAEEYDILVIEDAAQALGAEWKGRKAGSIGVAGCFSLFPAKIFGGVGNAGMVTTDDDELAEEVRMLRCNFNLGKNPNLEAGYGMNMEPDNIQAAVLNVKFPLHKANLERRKDIALRYDEAFKDLPIKLPGRQIGRVYQDYVIRVPKGKKEFVEYLKEKEIGILGHNLVPHHDYLYLGVPYLPVTDRYIKEQIRIPCNHNLTDEEVNYVIETIKTYDKW